MSGADRGQPSGTRPLSIAAMLLRLGVIGAILLALAAAFAFVGGWLSPRRLTQVKLIDAFEQDNGVHPGFRRNHSKGVCVSGWFEATGAATLLSRSEMFRPGRVPVIGRFAIASGLPMQADSAASVRSLALRFLEPDGQEWRTGMNDIPVFTVNSVEAFYEQLVAAKPDPATGKPDPAAMQAFLERHPETAHALTLIKARTPTSGFADSTYNSLDAFRLLDAGGRSTPVRWSVAPIDPPPSDASASWSDKNHLFDELIAQMHRGPLRWRLLITVGQAGDPTAEAASPWPADRAQIDAGTVVLDAISSEDGGACTDINFDPTVLPAGIEVSDDPLLSARSSVYARSFTLRSAERRTKPPSAITPQETRAAGGT